MASVDVPADGPLAATAASSGMKCVLYTCGPRRMTVALPATWEIC